MPINPASSRSASRRSGRTPRHDSSDALAPNRAPGSAVVWFAAVIAGFLSIRALTTLAAGATFAAPGDGWRSLWQLAIVGILAFGLWRRAVLRACVAVVCAIYLGAALIELATPDALLGVIPVDMRDRIVHPLIAVLGAAVLAVDGRRVRRGPRSLAE